VVGRLLGSRLLGRRRIMEFDWEALKAKAQMFVTRMFVKPPKVEIISTTFGEEYEYIGYQALSLGTARIAPLFIERMATVDLCRRLEWVVLVSDSDTEKVGPFPTFVEACIVATMLWTAEELIEQFVE